MKKSLKSPAILKFLNYCNLSLRGALSSWDEIGSSQILSSQILSSSNLYSTAVVYFFISLSKLQAPGSNCSRCAQKFLE